MRRTKEKEKKKKANTNLKKIQLVDKGLDIVEKEKEKRRKEIEKNNVKTKKSLKESRKIDGRYKGIVILIIIVVVIILINNNYHKLGIVFVKNITEKDAIKITIMSSNNIIKEYQNEILVYSSGKYTTYNKYGKQTWQTKLDTTFIPEIYTAGKYIQICNKSNGYIYVLYNKYESARIKINGKIKSSNINQNGITIVEYATTGSKTALGVYDKSGEELYSIKLNTSTIGQYILSDSERYLAYTDVVIDGMSLITNINVIDLKKANDDNYEIPTVATENNELAYKLLFEGNKIVALFSSKAIKYKLSSKSLEQFNVPNVNLLNIDVNLNKFIYVYSNLDKYILSYLTFASDKSSDILLEDAPTGVTYYDDIVYISYKKKISIYNGFGNNIKNYSSDTILTKPVVFNKGKSIAVPTSNQIIIINI